MNPLDPTMARPIEILLVEDSPSDSDLTREALETAKVCNRLSVVEGGQHYYRDVGQSRVGLKAAAHLKAVNVRQFYVQHNQVKPFLLGHAQPAQPGFRPIDAAPVMLQGQFEFKRLRWAIFHNQNNFTRPIFNWHGRIIHGFSTNCAI